MRGGSNEVPAARPEHGGLTLLLPGAQYTSN